MIRESGLNNRGVSKDPWPSLSEIVDQAKRREDIVAPVQSRAY